MAGTKGQTINKLMQVEIGTVPHHTDDNEDFLNGSVILLICRFVVTFGNPPLIRRVLSVGAHTESLCDLLKAHFWMKA
ncbi:MAG: hypothetical protein GY820_32390 [Gammaproteobacteria bacterium]|nr:hypothetical protein [Gammaproteobacteria bacterium]